jgi:phenylpropionate dioxygenase-like ring-hydroxylating dioxygenase large terminal subunit
MIPQFPFEQPVPEAKARSFRAKTRYGYVWVALDEPLSDIPAISEDEMPGYRRINQFYEKWNTAALRLMENSFDNAHFAFVHKGTFGDINQPKPEKYEITETDDGFDAETIITVRNPPGAYRITGTTEPTTRRHQRNKWFIPFCRRLDMEYPSGIRHIIFNCATPISDGQIQVVQLLFRNDTEADCSTQELIDWDAAIIAEDRGMLESTDPDAIVDMGRKIEMHMPSDRPGMIMRKRLLELLHAHHEEERPKERVA